MEVTVLIDVLLSLVAVLVLIPVVVLTLEATLALFPRRSHAADIGQARSRCAVLVPAHNEEAGISQTVAAIVPQLNSDDRLVVVADNCTDRTAELARAAGAAVLERHDAARRGKGYALDFGVRALEADPPDVVIVIDADCGVDPGTVAALIRQAAATGKPVQGGYLLDAPPTANVRDQLSAFAFLFKNVVRPLGMSRLGWPCLLMGTGMAFPWKVISRAALASGNIVEDMQLGIDLSVAGHSPRLCLDAQVRGELPSARSAALSQRTRWEHGHLQTISKQVPRLLWQALRQARWDLLGLALELGVPPLSFLCLGWIASSTAALAWWALGGSSIPAVLLVVGGLFLVAAILLAWAKFGRERLPFTSLLATPFYVLAKVPIYLGYFVRRQRAWVRTERDRPAPASPPAPGKR